MKMKRNNVVKIASYSEFIKIYESLNSDIEPIQILMRGTIGLTSKEESFTRDAMETLYEKYIKLVLIKMNDDYNTDDNVPDNRLNKIDFNLPILNFTSTEHEFHKDKRSTIINPVSETKYSSDKKIFHETFKDSDFVPNAVFKKSDVGKLSEPIIAKPADGFSAQGIELFDTVDDAKKSNSKFDLWSEAKDIDREFRAFVIKGKVIHISERITNTKNDKSVGKKDKDEKIDLVYIDQDLDKFPTVKRIQEIADEISNSIDLDFYNIDLILDKAGEFWVPEINSAPGIGPSMFHTIYKLYMKDIVGSEISNSSDKELEKIASDHRKNMKAEYKDEYKNSLLPK